MNKAAIPSLTTTNLIVFKEDLQARTVGGRAVHDRAMVHNFKRVSAFSPLLICSKHFADVHLKTAKMIVFYDAPYVK